MKALILFASQWKEMRNLRLWLSWFEHYSVQDIFRINILQIAFDNLNSSSSTDFAKLTLLQRTQRHQIIHDRDSSTYVVLDIERWRRIEEGLSDASSFHESVLNRFEGENSLINRLRIFFELRLYIIHRSDDVVFCLNLLLERSLSCFDESIHDAFDFLILVVNRLFFCSIQKLELWCLNAMIKLISMMIQLLDFCFLTQARSLLVSQSLESSRVDQSIHSIDSLNRLRTRLCASICNLSVVLNHAKQIVAMKYDRADLIHDQVANSLIRIRIVWWIIMSSLLSWIRSLKTHRWWHFQSLVEDNRSSWSARSLSLLLNVSLSRDTYRRLMSHRARFEILVWSALTYETSTRLACLLFKRWVDSSVSFERSASELSRESCWKQERHRRCRQDWWCKILHRKQNLYWWKICRFYCRLVRLMNSIFRLSLMISCTSYETWFWWVSAAT